jgi:mitochondrial-processing peptidase subunit alpha
MYQSATFNSGVGDTIALLAETIRNPRITPEEIEQQLETADYEITEIWAKPELILPELVHVAAYRDNTLGNPLLCPKERLPVINRNVVDAYRKTFFLPERIVVAFAGVEHEKAVKMTEKWFGDMERGRGVGLPSPELPNAHGSEPVSSLPSKYCTRYPALPRC